MIKKIISCVPSNEYQVSDLIGSELGDHKSSEIISSTGISRVRILPDDLNTSDLFYKASREIIDDEKGSPQIDALICVTQTPDYLCPNVSSLLHERLGLEKDCITFDINQGCSGYIYGLFIANQLLKTDSINNILLCVGDANHKNISKENYSLRALFGDAGTVTLLTGDGIDSSYFKFGSDGKGAKHLGVPNFGFRIPGSDEDIFKKLEGIERKGLFMDGPQVFMFGIREVPKFLNSYVKTLNSEINYLVLHQANMTLLKSIEKKCDFHFTPLYSLEKFGNTSSATIPLTLCANDFSFKNSKILLCGFGIGWSWGLTHLDLKEDFERKIIEL